MAKKSSSSLSGRLKIPAPARISMEAPPQSTQSLAVAAGAEPEVQTIIYVHGIGNKPPASVLKCQWDSALFRAELGDRSRMAYWVNREYYPTPLSDTCGSGDVIRIDDDEITTASVMALSSPALATASAIVRENEALKRELEELAAAAPSDSVAAARQAFLESMARRMTSQSDAAAAGENRQGPRIKVLPFPPFLRRLITRKVTRAFLRDVNDFLFVPRRRQAMERSLTERLAAGGGPFVVVAHSQGSLIAYNVLRQLKREQCDVHLFVTIGSPLGMQEVQDVLREWSGGTLRIPPCVRRWVNVADRLDPVAIDTDLRGEFKGSTPLDNEARLGLNLDSPRHPHSATGYLGSREVRRPVLETVGHAFAQAVGKAVIIKDLSKDIEDAGFEERHPALIQLRAGGDSGGLEVLRQRLIDRITDLVTRSGSDVESADTESMKRFVAARLTRFEIERLRTEFADLKIEKVWRNARKRALISLSTHTIQARPANLGYGAVGRNVSWAVLDTGIAAGHPHFQRFNNVVAQYDCTAQGGVREVDRADPEFTKLDKNGHGTHVAGIIAGSMRVKSPEGGEETFDGMAPESRLYGFKVLDENGNGRDSWIIKALDKIAGINDSAGQLIVQGVNLSLGGNFDPSAYNCGHTPLCQELRRLWNQGVLVCLAAGNEGYAILQAAEGQIPANLDLSIGDPANLEEAIAVGSIHRTNPHTFGISYFSSRGPTADGRPKPDLVAPGEQILSAYHRFKKKSNEAQYRSTDLYIEMSGTSMATPHVSGLLAAFLSVRREFIGYPDRVKRILLDNCTDIGRDRYTQGRGMPNLIRMLTNS